MHHLGLIQRHKNRKARHKNKINTYIECMYVILTFIYWVAQVS